jgi:predicted nucleic acid-binding protein
MIDLGAYDLLVGVEKPWPLWAEPLDQANRRDAAFVDTSYLAALLNPEDERHGVVTRHARSTRVLRYTTSFVVCETVRQIVKGGYARLNVRQARVSECKRVTLDDGDILICSPSREMVAAGYSALQEMQMTFTKLDLCDAISFVTLDALRHRRVLGFDHHFRSAGAQLEPTGS